MKGLEITDYIERNKLQFMEFEDDLSTAIELLDDRLLIYYGSSFLIRLWSAPDPKTGERDFKVIDEVEALEIRAKDAVKRVSKLNKGEEN